MSASLYHSGSSSRVNVSFLRRRGAALRSGGVLGGVEHQAVVAVQRRVLTPNLVDHRDQLAKAARVVALPAANLVLLGVEVLLGTGLLGATLAQLERGSVDSVARAQCCGQDEPCCEGRPATVLQVLGENVRGIRPEVGAQELTHRR